MKAAVPNDGFPERIHCVGIGGGGVSALARLLAVRGHSVTGSDQTGGGESLRPFGIAVSRGHHARHLGDAQLIIRSAAVPDDNPEVVAARARGTAVLKYSEALGRLMDTRRGVAVAGTHGKTTTTALVAHLLHGAGADPAWVVGGTPLSLPGASAWGRGDAMVVEACEYGHSFLDLSYEIALVTGVSADHLDWFGDEESVRAAFRRFASRVQSHGTLVLGSGVPADMRWVVPDGVRIVEAGSAVRLIDVRESATGFDGRVETERDGAGDFRLPLLGRHNLDNLRAALATALATGEPLAALLPHVATFTGVARRLQDLGERRLAGPSATVRLVDDFAHHPEALLAAAEAVRGRWPDRRLVAIFQPHQISRTEDFLDGFVETLGRFDVVGLCDIFVARDTAPERAEDVCAKLAEASGARRLGPARGCDERLLALLRPGDACLIMGAGDVDELAPRLARAAARP